MKRTLEQWQGCNPTTMTDCMSKRGVIRTLEEARADILELHAEAESLHMKIEKLKIALQTVRKYARSDVCCCGDLMNDHPLYSNHAPRDELDYYISETLKDLE